MKNVDEGRLLLCSEHKQICAKKHTWLSFSKLDNFWTTLTLGQLSSGSGNSRGGSFLNSDRKKFALVWRYTEVFFFQYDIFVPIILTNALQLNNKMPVKIKLECAYFRFWNVIFRSGKQLIHTYSYIFYVFICKEGYINAPW